jgi:UDP-N-acetylmuramate--alanine ligase
MKQALQLVPGQRVHLIGIGGSGLSPIARVLLLQGYQVSGSDMKGSKEGDALRELGAKVYRGHDPAYVSGAEFVIASSAIKEDHVEILSAKAQGIPVYKRSDVIGAIMQGYTGIAIAGTHGKTTTTSMTVHLLKQTGQDPTYIVGGVLGNTGMNANVGQGKAFVVEADEYDNMFHGLRPKVEVITSVEFDHPDFFRTPNQMVESFSHFVGLLPEDGLLVACADDPTAQIFARNRQIVAMPSITYGIDNPADWRAVNIRYEEGKMLFDLLIHEKESGTIHLSVPGRHNILNAMAALIVAQHEGVDLADAANALTSFKSTGRRFELRADIRNIAIIDDYAHHPTAIKTTIEAARQRFPERELWAVWQPHTFSRTQVLWGDYLQAFDEAEHVIVTDIFASREADNPAIRSSNFVAELKHPSKFHAETFEDAGEILKQHVKAPAVILIMSAGDAPLIGIDYLKSLEASS